MTLDSILSAIATTEAVSFGKFCHNLKGCPRAGDTGGWREVFALLNQAEREKLVIVFREEEDEGENKILRLYLTDSGANRVRSKLDGKRELFDLL